MLQNNPDNRHIGALNQKTARLHTETFVEIFIAEYKRIKPVTAKQFNEKRTRPGTYSAETMKAKLGVKSWQELLEKLSLKKYAPPPPKPVRLIKSYKVIVI